MTSRRSGRARQDSPVAEDRHTPVIGWFDAVVFALLASLVVATSQANFFCDRGGFVDEAIPHRQALSLWGWGRQPPTLDPHFFSYPSVSIYVQWIAQWCAVTLGGFTGRYSHPADAGVEYVLDQTYLVTASRVCAAISVLACAWLLARRRGPVERGVAMIVGACLCVTPLMIRATLEMPPEVVMCPAVVLLVSLAATNERTGRFRELSLGVLAGLLCGLKLSAVPCALLCLWVAASRQPAATSRAIQMLRLSGIAVATFCLTTPFAILDFHRFASDLSFEWQHLRSGHLGGARTETLRAHSQQLFDATGLALPAAAVLAFGLRPEVTRRAWLALGCAVTFLLPAVLSKTGGPERYVVPAIPLLWLFLRDVAVTCVQQRRAARRAAGATVVALAAWQGIAMARSTLPKAEATPAARAGDWVRANTSPSDLVVQEYGALALYTRDQQEELASSRCLSQASNRWVSVARATVPHSVVTIPFVAAGEVATSVASAAGDPVAVRVFQPGWKMLPSIYQPLHWVSIRCLVRNESIAARLGQVSPELGFDHLVSAASTKVLFAPERHSGSSSGHGSVVIENQATAADVVPALAADWWTRDASFEIEGERAAVLSASERAATVSRARQQVFRQQFEPFLLSLARISVERNDGTSVASLARLLIENDPEEVTSIQLAILALGELGVARVASHDGLNELRRMSGEPSESWIGRVLAQWGADRGVATSELAHYAGWRRR